MASRLIGTLLIAAWLLLAVEPSGAQSPQPTTPPVVATSPQPRDPSPEVLTPAQQKLILQLIESVLGRDQPPQPLIAPPTIAQQPPSGPGPGVTFFPQLTPSMAPPNMPMAPSPRFSFKFDKNEPITTLLPAAPKTPSKLPIWTNEDLTKVPEVTFGEPVAKNLDKTKALEATAHILAKVNQLNARKTDSFMLAMMEHRTDLRGLPYLMGDECRTREEQARTFHVVANALNQNIRATNQQQVTDMLEFLSAVAQQARGHFNRINHEKTDRAIVAALTQILMPESERSRTGLAKFLARVQHIDATKALARLAIYSPEDEVRAAAIEGLKLRRERDYTDILLEGFRYPLPAVAKRSAEALVKLERADLIPNIVEVLERSDPRLPMTQKRDGKDITVVRELVKLNHHRNCALCHAPGNTENMPDGILTVAVPLPSEPLPKPSQGGYQSTPPPSPDVVVRIDMTYLRQDFSVMMPVADAHPWPEMQRFDFLVRTRELTQKEAQGYEPCCEIEEPGRLSSYHRSALYALRELTGRDTEPTAAAWRKLLKLPK